MPASHTRRASRKAAREAVKEPLTQVFDQITGKFISFARADEIGEEEYPNRFLSLATSDVYHPNKNTFKKQVEETVQKSVEETIQKPVQKPAQKLPQVISMNHEPPEPQIKKFAEYPDGVVPGCSIPMMYILGFLAVVFKNEEMSVGELIDSITEMVGFPVEVYSLGKGKKYIICFKSSIKDLFAAVDASYRARHDSKIAIRKYQSDRFREDTRCFPIFHPDDPIFQENKRKMKTIPEEVEASTNSFATLSL